MTSVAAPMPRATIYRIILRDRQPGEAIPLVRAFSRDAARMVAATLHGDRVADVEEWT